MARMAHAQIEEFNPIAEINTTPLIDLMLVLLVMFIIIVPVSTHKVDADLPVAGDPPATTPPVHRLDLDAAGQLYWDGRAMPRSELNARLAALRSDPAEPLLQMNADSETRYERFDEIFAAVRRAGITRLGFVDMGRFGNAF